MKKIAVAVAIHGKIALIRYIQFPEALRENGEIITGPAKQPLLSLESASHPQIGPSLACAYTPGVSEKEDNKMLVKEFPDPRAVIASLGLLIRMANWKHQLTEEPGPEELKLVPKGFFVIS